MTLSTVASRSYSPPPQFLVSPPPAFPFTRRTPHVHACAAHSGWRYNNVVQYTLGYIISYYGAALYRHKLPAGQNDHCDPLAKPPITELMQCTLKYDPVARNVNAVDCRRLYIAEWTQHDVYKMLT